MDKCERMTSIDRYRGLMVFFMIIFNFFKKYDCFGILGKVAQQKADKGIALFNGFTVHDIAVGVFFYAVALSFVLSFQGRLKLFGKKETYKHFIERGLSIIGIGTCLRVPAYLSKIKKYHFIYLSGSVTALCVVSIFALLLCSTIPSLKNKKNIVSKLTRNLICINGLLTIIYGSYNAVLLLSGNYHILRAWSVLPAVGIAILIALPSANLAILYKGLYGLVLFVFYAYLYKNQNFGAIVDKEVQGGMLGAVSWGSLLVFYSVFADIYFKEKKESGVGHKTYKYLLAILISIIVAIIGSKYFEINKETVSPGFVLVSIPIATFIFAIVEIFDDYKPNFCPFIWWGENPLLLFVFEFLFIDAPISEIPYLKGLGLMGASLYITLLVLIFSFVCYKIGKKNIVIKL